MDRRDMLLDGKLNGVGNEVCTGLGNDAVAGVGRALGAERVLTLTASVKLLIFLFGI